MKPVSIQSTPCAGPAGMRWEIGLVLIIKFLLLGILWFVIFRADPAQPRPSSAALFAATAVSFPVNNGAAP